MLRQLQRPSFLATVTGGLAVVVLLALIVHIGSHRRLDSLNGMVRLVTSPDTSKSAGAANAEEMIERQLRPDQGRLASIGQHALSAYFDTRDTLGGVKYVRIISVLDTRAYEREFVCQFMHDWGQFSYATVAKKSAIGAGMGHDKRYYKEHVLSCPISNDTQTAAYVFLQTWDALLRSQVMKVKHNPLSLGQKPTYPKQIINCVSVTFGKPNELRLIEWLEAQRLLKMDKVQLHFYDVQNEAFKRVAKAYSDEGFLEVRQIPCPFCAPGKADWLTLLLMSPAINQCLYENLGRYTYTAVFDLDEIIVPQKHPDYPSLLSDLEKREKTRSFAFRNWYHFFELGEDTSAPVDMPMLRHPYSTKTVSPPGYSAKSIHKSCCVVALHNHFSWEDVPDRDTGSGHLAADVDLGLNEHYKKCHFNEKECKEMTKQSDRQDGFRLHRLIGKELTTAFRSKARQILGKD